MESKVSLSRTSRSSSSSRSEKSRSLMRSWAELGCSWSQDSALPGLSRPPASRLACCCRRDRLWGQRSEVQRRTSPSPAVCVCVCVCACVRRPAASAPGGSELPGPTLPVLPALPCGRRSARWGRWLRTSFLSSCSDAGRLGSGLRLRRRETARAVNSCCGYGGLESLFHLHHQQICLLCVKACFYFGGKTDQDGRFLPLWRYRRLWLDSGDERKMFGSTACPS